MKGLIEKKIKSVYGTKENFCNENGHDPTSFNKKLRTAENKLKWLDDFLYPIGLRVQVWDLEKLQEHDKKENGPR